MPPITSAWIGCATEEVLEHEAEQARRDQLRDDDEEIEDAHEHAHLLRRHAVGQQGVGQRQDRSPGEADADHRQQQPLRVADHDERQQAEAAETDVDQVCDAQSHAAHHRRDHQGGERGEAVVGREQHADPVRALVVGRRRRIAAAEVDRGHRCGGVQPHREQAEPGEELHDRELAHRRRHVAQVVDDARERAVAAAAGCGRAAPRRSRRSARPGCTAACRGRATRSARWQQRRRAARPAPCTPGAAADRRGAAATAAPGPRLSAVPADTRACAVPSTRRPRARPRRRSRTRSARCPALRPVRRCCRRRSLRAGTAAGWRPPNRRR